MIKKFEDFINEDFAKMYKIWKNKDEHRKEDYIKKVKAEISQFIEKYNMTDNCYDINFNDKCIDFNEDINLKEIEDLTFKIGSASGFNASDLGLTNEDLINFPKYVDFDFNISQNNLKNFVGCPEEVGEDFIALDCNALESLEGLPKHIGGNLLITTPNDPTKFSEKDIPTDTKVDGTIRFALRRRR